MEVLERKEIKKNRVEVTKDNPVIKIGVYGTLRVDENNWRHLLKDKSKYLGTYRTEPKFTMVGRHCGFPITFTGGETSIEYDLFEVTDNKVLNSLHNLEGCTGIENDENGWYKLIRLKNEEHGDFFIYLQHGYGGAEDRVIKSGNWKDKDE